MVICSKIEKSDIFKGIAGMPDVTVMKTPHPLGRIILFLHEVRTVETNFHA